MGECTAKALSSALIAVVVAPWALQLASAAPATEQADEWVHTIAPGDTLLGLRARLLRPEARWQMLQKLNRIADPRRLTPGVSLRIPVAMLREEAAQAEVMHSHGEVWMERAGAARQALKAAMALLGGDVVLTGNQSSVSLRFADGTRTLVGPNSRLQLDRLVRLGPGGTVDSRVRLDNGSLETQVPPEKPPKRFEIRTPTANLSVRGTEFRSRTDGTRSLAEVLQGRVAAGPQTVNAGFGVVATASGVGAPRTLLAPPNLSGMPDRVERVPLHLAIATEVGREIRPEVVSQAGLLRYRAQIFEADPANPGGRLLLDGIFDQPFAQWPDNLADGRYELRVRALDAEGIEGIAGSKAFTLKARPEPPFLLRPRAAERLFDESVTLAWSRNPDAATYKLQVSPNADFSPPLVERSGLTSADTQLPLPLGTLHWRMAAVRADGDQGPWSDTRIFERAEPPAAPVPQTPKASDEGLILAWSASRLTGVSYQVQVARDPAFTDLALDAKTEGTEVLFPRPESGMYHVRLRTLAADGRPGPYGATQLIEVPRSLWWLWLLPLLLLL